MDFFTRLSELITGMQLTMTIKEKNGKITVSVLPDGIDKVLPLIITATPEELDAQFIEKISKPIEQAGLVINATEFEKSIASAAKKSTPAKGTTGKKEAATEEPEEHDEDEQPEKSQAKKAVVKKTGPLKEASKKPASSENQAPKQMEIM